MKLELNKKHGKIIVSSIILIAAIAIVLPMLLSFALALGRVILTIAIIVLVTLAISIGTVRYKHRQEITKQKMKVEN